METLMMTMMEAKLVLSEAMVALFLTVVKVMLLPLTAVFQAIALMATTFYIMGHYLEYYLQVKLTNSL